MLRTWRGEGILSDALLLFHRRAEQTMAMPAVHRRWTAAEVRELQDESRAWPRYELLDGELLVTPGPGFAHQLAVTELLVLLRDYVNQFGIGCALTSPSDIELRAETIMQPDVFVCPVPAGRAPRDMSWADVASLILAVEVISPSSVRTDRTRKRDFYLANGVAEYWVVDLDARQVERSVPGSGTPVIEKTTIEWRPAGAPSSLVIDLKQLFLRVSPT